MGILAAQTISTFALNPPSPPSPHPHSSSYPALLLAFIAVLRLRCQQSSTSSSKSAAFFSSLYAGYLTTLPGKQILCSIQQLERCRLINQDLEGAPATPSHFPFFPGAHQHLHFRSVPRSQAASSKARGSRTLAGGYGTSKTLWSIPTTPALSESSRGSPSIWETNSTRRKEGM